MSNTYKPNFSEVKMNEFLGCASNSTSSLNLPSSILNSNGNGGDTGSIDFGGRFCRPMQGHNNMSLAEHQLTDNQRQINVFSSAPLYRRASASCDNSMTLELLRRASDKTCSFFLNNSGSGIKDDDHHKKLESLLAGGDSSSILTNPIPIGTTGGGRSNSISGTGSFKGSFSCRSDKMVPFALGGGGGSSGIGSGESQSNTTGSTSSPLTSSGNFSDNSYSSMHGKNTVRAIRAANCTTTGVGGGSGSTGHDSRSSSPSDSDSSSLSTMSNWISNLSLGTSVTNNNNNDTIESIRENTAVKRNTSNALLPMPNVNSLSVNLQSAAQLDLEPYVPFIVGNSNINSSSSNSNNQMSSNSNNQMSSNNANNNINNSSNNTNNLNMNNSNNNNNSSSINNNNNNNSFLNERRSMQSTNVFCNWLEVFGDTIERAAKLHRCAASYSEAKCTWSGQLPNRIHKNPVYSSKVFLGGVPWDINDVGLIEAFSIYGPIKVQWPGKEVKNFTSNGSQKAGYVYIIFESERQVKALLQSCTHDYSNGGKWYYNISSRRMRCKEVQVIPWILADSNYVRCPSQRLDPNKTVFVGALHGMLTAEGLAHIMNDLFGGVVYVGIDTDKHKYPLGSGRVTFSNSKSYVKAVSAGFIEIKCARFNKKIQIDPYLENSICSACQMQQGPIFCRDLSCFRYFCRGCFQWTHSAEPMRFHRPIMRNRRDN